MQVCVNVCIKKGDTLLMVEENKPYIKGLINIPGGHLEENENIIEGAVREVLEETGLKIKITGLVGVYNAITTKKKYHLINFIFLGEVLEETGSYWEHEIVSSAYYKISDLKTKYVDKLRNTRLLETFERLEKDEIYPLNVIKDFIVKQ